MKKDVAMSEKGEKGRGVKNTCGGTHHGILL